jgi:hypothetical protein
LVVSVVVVVEELVSVLLEVPEAPMLEEPLVLGVAAVVPPALPLCELLLVLGAGAAVLLSLLLGVVALLPLLLGAVPLLEVWPMAKPTPPASAAAAASVVTVLLIAFISMLLDKEAPAARGAAGKGGRKMLAGASCFSP